MPPNTELAVVENAKVRDYLLSGSHPIGRFKSVVFLALGYRPEEWPDLAALAKSGLADVGERTPHGQKYVVSGKLTGPNGRLGQFTTVWIILNDEAFPRFVTAVPE